MLVSPSTCASGIRRLRRQIALDNARRQEQFVQERRELAVGHLHGGVGRRAFLPARVTAQPLFVEVIQRHHAHERLHHVLPVARHRFVQQLAYVFIVEHAVFKVQRVVGRGIERVRVLVVVRVGDDALAIVVAQIAHRRQRVEQRHAEHVLHDQIARDETAADKERYDAHDYRQRDQKGLQKLAFPLFEPSGLFSLGRGAVAGIRYQFALLSHLFVLPSS